MKTKKPKAKKTKKTKKTKTTKTTNKAKKARPKTSAATPKPLSDFVATYAGKALTVAVTKALDFEIADGSYGLYVFAWQKADDLNGWLGEETRNMVGSELIPFAFVTEAKLAGNEPVMTAAKNVLVFLFYEVAAGTIWVDRGFEELEGDDDDDAEPIEIHLGGTSVRLATLAKAITAR